MEKELFLNELRNRNISYVEDVVNKNGIDIACVVVGDDNIRPNIYMDTIATLTTENIDDFLSRIFIDKPSVDLNEFFNRENVLNNCVVCLAYDLSQDVASVDFLGMKVYLRLFLNNESSIVIKNEHLRYFDLSFDDVLENAKKNIKAICKDMVDVMLEFGRIEPDMLDFLPRNQMLVISNKSNLYGANAMFDSDLLDSICDIFENEELFLLPSSIHECIAVRKNDSIDYMIDMIRTVNANEVSETEILSNNLFIYERDTKSLRIAN